MTNKEIRIGNYVLATETEGSEDQIAGLVTHYPIQIEVIYGDTILDNYGCERDIESLEPIKLTTEVLRDLGMPREHAISNWRELGDDEAAMRDWMVFRLRLDKGHIFMELLPADNGEWTVFIRSQTEVMTNGHVKGLHHLQNILTDFDVPFDFDLHLE